MPVCMAYIETRSVDWNLYFSVDLAMMTQITEK